MKERILDKIGEISKYLEELSEIVPADYDSYIADSRDRAACERFFEKIIEACVDLAFIVVKYKKLDLPKGDKEIFKILEKNKLISADISRKLSEAKGMRNILAHEYGKVNDQLVYEAVHEELVSDVETFLNQIEKLIAEDDNDAATL